MRPLALVVLAGCWSAPAPKPALVVAQPVPAGPPADAKIVAATELDVLDADELISADGEVEAMPPWRSVRTGWREHEFVLEVEVDTTMYTTSLAGGVDGALTPILRFADVLPGKPVELVIEVEHIRDGGKGVSVVVCGIGPSHKPSCGDHHLGSFELQDEPIALRTPPTGGVNAIVNGKLQKLWFQFP